MGACHRKELGKFLWHTPRSKEEPMQDAFHVEVLKECIREERYFQVLHVRTGEDQPRTVFQSNPRDMGHLRMDVANLARAEPDKCSGEADMLKDMTDPELVEELQRS
uniref:Uncharacterized protein n=1 Tax=Tanacetum cinerariifolium TaxID=118510 RepID=A0A6L2NU26_TANCI|nr:hypothetical protein [Tanacetum cinerariifolium]